MARRHFAEESVRQVAAFVTIRAASGLDRSAEIQSCRRGSRRDYSLSLLWLLCAFFSFRIEAAESSSSRSNDLPLTTALQVRQLSFQQAKRGSPVRIEGIVSYVDSKWDMLFVQDATCGVFVEPVELRRPLPAGARVEVQGFVEPGAYNAFVARGRIKVKGQDTLPKAEVRLIRTLAKGTDDGKRVEVKGRVRSVTVEDERLLLYVNDGNDWIKVFVDNAPEESLRPLMNAKVRVQGVCTVNADERREILSVQMFVPDPTFVIVQEPAPKDLFALPIRNITELTNPEALTNQIRVQGVVQSNTSGGSTLVRDATGSIQIEAFQASDLKPGLLLDVVGSPTQRNGVTILNSITFRRIGIVGTDDPAPAASSVRGDRTLTTVKQVRVPNLPAIAQRHHGVANAFLVECPPHHVDAGSHGRHHGHHFRLDCRTETPG